MIRIWATFLLCFAVGNGLSGEEFAQQIETFFHAENVTNLLVIEDGGSSAKVFNSVPFITGMFITCGEARVIQDYIMSMQEKDKDFVHVVLLCDRNSNKKIIQDYTNQKDAILGRSFINIVTIDDAENENSVLSKEIKDGDTFTNIVPEPNGTAIYHCRQNCQASGARLSAYMYDDKVIYWKHSHKPLLQNAFTSFNGLTLRATYKMVEKENSTIPVLDGVCFRLLTNLAKSLNFKFELNFPEDHSYGALKDGKWTGMIGHVARKEYDFAVADITVTGQRSTVVDFSVPFWQDYNTLVYAAPPLRLNFWYFLKPIQWQVLVTLACALVVANFFGQFMEHMTFLPGRTKLGRNMNFLGDAMRIMFLQSIVRKIKKGSQRYIIAASWLTSIVVSATFTGNLVTFLVTNTIQLPLKTVEDVAGSDFSLAVTNYTSHYDLLMGANTGMYKELKDRTKVFFDPSLTDTQRFEALLKDDELAYMFDETAMKDLLKDYGCEIFTLEKGFFMTGFALALPRKSPILKHMNKELQKMLDNGLLHHWGIQFTNFSRCDLLQSQTKARALSLGDSIGVFMLMGGGCVGGFLIFFFELVWKKLCGKGGGGH